MADKDALLHELKIRRDKSSKQKSNLAGRLATIGMVATLSSVVWFFFPESKTQASSSQLQTKEVPEALESSLSGRVDKGDNVVGTVAVAKVPSRVLLDASGYVIARKKATVSTEVTGRLSESHIEEGMSVSEGQVLARLDSRLQRLQTEKSRSLYQVSKAQVEEVAVALYNEQRDLERFETLVSQGSLTRARLEEQKSMVDGLAAQLAAKKAHLEVAKNDYAFQKQLLANMEIVAPFDGVVIAKTAQVGEIISPVSAGGGYTRTGLCTIVDMQSLEIEVDVNEAYIDRVKPGQEVSATLNSYPDWKIPARVTAIVPTADRAKASVRVRIAIEDQDPRILPEMSIKVSFLGENT